MMWLFSCAIAGLLQGVFPTHLSGSFTIYDVAGSGAAHGAAHVTQYVFYRHTTTYNEARAICLEIGGDLAKVESLTKQNWIAGIGNDAIFDEEDIWTGLTTDASGDPVWVPDCSTDISSITINTDDGEAGKKCFLLKEESFTFKRKACIEEKFFLCELYIVVNATDCDVDPSYTDSGGPNNACNSLPSSSSTTSTTSTAGTTTSITTNTASTTSSTTRTAGTSSTTTNTAGTSSTTTITAGTTSSTTSTASTTSTTLSSSGTSSAGTTSTTTLSTPGTISTSTSTVAPVTPPSTQVTTTTATSTSGGTPVPTTTVAALLCLSVSNISVAEAVDLAAEISKNLTIDAKKTSAHRRSLTSADDNRSSAKAIGYLGIFFVVTPFGMIFLSDIFAMIRGLRHYNHIFVSKKK